MRSFILSVCLMTLACVNVFAQGVEFTAQVDPNKIGLGTTAQLTLTVTGTQDVAEVPESYTGQYLKRLFDAKSKRKKAG